MVSGILQGDERALRVFYQTYRRPLSRFISNRIANEQDNEELLQDVLVGAIDALRDFSFRSSLFTFLCSIAQHKIIDFYRRKKIRHVVFSKLGDVESLLSSLSGPEDALNDELVRVKIRETFRKIVPAYGKILKWKYIYGYSVEEIAQKLSTTYKSTESQLFRARKAFVAAYSI